MTVHRAQGGSIVLMHLGGYHTLEALPGIGPTTAARIVRSRGNHPFARIEELQTRGLITARVFADIKDMVTTR